MIESTFLHTFTCLSLFFLLQISSFSLPNLLRLLNRSAINSQRKLSSGNASRERTWWTFPKPKPYFTGRCLFISKCPANVMFTNSWQFWRKSGPFRLALTGNLEGFVYLQNIFEQATSYLSIFRKNPHKTHFPQQFTNSFRRNKNLIQKSRYYTLSSISYQR